MSLDMYFIKNLRSVKSCDQHDIQNLFKAANVSSTELKNAVSPPLSKDNTFDFKIIFRTDLNIMYYNVN